MYAGRADSENRIKELKEDLSLDTFCLKSFDATDAAFRMGCVLYNLLADFRETVLPRSWFERRLRAVRDFVFLVGADLISQGRRIQIRFAMPQPDRPEFLRRLRTVSDGLPIAAQLEWSLTDQTPSHPDKIITPIPLLHSVPSHSFFPLIFSTAESGLKEAGSSSLAVLLKRVSGELYRDELRKGAAVLDIGLFGDRLFNRDIIQELRAGDGIFWEIKAERGFQS